MVKALFIQLFCRLSAIYYSNTWGIIITITDCSINTAVVGLGHRPLRSVHNSYVYVGAKLKRDICTLVMMFCG